MRRTLALLFFAIATTLGYAQHIPFEELLYKGQAVPFYGQGSAGRSQELMTVLRGSQFAERMANFVNATTRLRTNIGVGFAQCGEPNAFWNSQRGAIVFCTEMLELIADVARTDPDMSRLDRPTFSRIVEGAVWGIFFHEMAHALISVNMRLPLKIGVQDSIIRRQI